MKSKITLKDTELSTLLKMLNYYFAPIEAPTAAEPLKMLIIGAGRQTLEKLENKFFKAMENESRETTFKISIIEKSFLLIFLQNINPKEIEPYELATRQTVLVKLLKTI